MPVYLPKHTDPISQRYAQPVAAGPVEIGITFDRSSSMHSMREAAITGFNALLDEQKKPSAPTKVSLSFFSNEVTSVHDGVPISEIGPMQPAEYQPFGNTALFDGIGSMIEAIGNRVDPLSYVSRVLIVILTDGEENNSVRFSRADIFDQISYRRNACNWQFLFIGTDESAFQIGLSLGIQRSNIVAFDASPEGISKIMLALSSALRAYQLGDKNFMLLLKGKN